MNDLTKAAFYDVSKERDKQDEKQNHSIEMWASLIGKEYGVLCREAVEFVFDPTPEAEQRIYDAAVKTAATCIAMCECIMRVQQGDIRWPL